MGRYTPLRCNEIGSWDGIPRLDVTRSAHGTVYPLLSSIPPEDAERARPWRLHMRDGFWRRNHEPPLKCSDSSRRSTSLLRRYGVGKGRSPSGGFISGPLAASSGLSALFSLLSSLCSLLSMHSSLFSRCRSFLRSHFAPAPSISASGHRRRPQLRPFAAPSLARRNARSD